MNLHIIIPHFKCERWLSACLQCLCRRASRQHDIHIDVLTMELDESERQRVKDNHVYFYQSIACSITLNVHDFPMKGKGGEILPYILRAGVRLLPDADITMTVDPDALTILPNWDRYIVDQFTYDPGLTCIGINPRHTSPEFNYTPEWNWMALRTKHYRDHHGSFDPKGLHDIGHRFGRNDLAGKFLTIPPLVLPFKDKPAAICGVGGVPYVLHAFYSSRRVADYISDDDRRGILTPEQETELIQWALNPSASWGITHTSPAL